MPENLDIKRADDPVEVEGISRLAECRRWKALWDLDLREAYFFATPQRQRNVLSTTAPPQQRLLDSAELMTDLAFELCGDFTTEVINAYMPEHLQWCELGRGMFLTEEQFNGFKEQADKNTDQIFQAIRASNFYPELAKACDPDLAIGTVALWIEQVRPGQPIVVSAIPIHEFEINLGPYGEIDDRFAIRWTRNSYVRRLLGEEIWSKVDGELKTYLEQKPVERTELRWGFWRLWDDPSDEVWQHVVYVKNKLVHKVVIRGEGCCPMLPFRWNPNPDWPWGHGPLLQYMPTLRQIDEFDNMRMEHAELALRPPIGYPDDSFAALDQGLEPGMAYPMRAGSQVVKIYEPPETNAAEYQYEEKEKRLRRGFFIGFPEQRGDTPPTATQWLDEMAREQRRIGRPGLTFFREGPAKIFLRFKYLLEHQGTIQPIRVNGAAVSLMPYNPTQRAAEQQDIAMAVHGLEIGAQLFPEEFKMWVDGAATFKALIDKMRIELIKFRKPAQVDHVLSQMKQLIGSTPPGGQRAAAIGTVTQQQLPPT